MSTRCVIIKRLQAHDFVPPHSLGSLTRNWRNQNQISGRCLRALGYNSMNPDFVNMKWLGYAFSGVTEAEVVSFCHKRVI